MARHVVAGFQPSVHGFHFSNCFPHVPVVTVRGPGGAQLRIGDAAGGLCGGMAYAVRDLFEAGLLPPDHTDPPHADSPLFRWLARRLIESFALPQGPLRYYLWMALPDRGNLLFPGIIDRTLREWPRVRAELEAGRLVALGLIRACSRDPRRVGENHQVLAYGCEIDEPARHAHLLIYDPNCPNDDDVRLTLDLTGRDPPAYTGGSVRGFFRTAYKRCKVPADISWPRMKHE